MATRSVTQKEEKLNPDPTKVEVKLKMIALMMTLNRPKVSIVIGKESNTRIGFINKFNNPNTRLAPMATKMLST